MAEDKKDPASSGSLSATDRPQTSPVEEQLLEGNWKVMYTIAKDGSGGSGPDGDSDGGGGSGGSGSSSSDTGSSGNSSPA